MLRQALFVALCLLPGLVVASDKDTAKHLDTVVRVYTVEPPARDATGQVATVTRDSSGVIVFSDANSCLVLTNHHSVAGDGVKHSIKFKGSTQRVDAKVIKVDAYHDLAAVVVANPHGIRGTGLSSKSALQIGDQVFMAGWGARTYDAGWGAIDYITKRAGGDFWYDVAWPSDNGDSGGPALDEAGRLITVRWACGSVLRYGEDEAFNYSSLVDPSGVRKVLGNLQSRYASQSGVPALQVSTK
jgi:S1-C subfamily serine protease